MTCPFFPHHHVPECDEPSTAPPHLQRKGPDMKAEIVVESYRSTKFSREQAKRGDIPPIWKNAWVVRFHRPESATEVWGAGSSQRVAAMRAAEAAVKEGWF
jgi:hypothetical protein